MCAREEVHHSGSGRYPRVHPGGGGARPTGAGRRADGPELLPCDPEIKTERASQNPVTQK